MLTEEQVQALIDRQLEIERKARAWDDLWAVMAVEHNTKVLDLMSRFVHPAQASSKS